MKKFYYIFIVFAALTVFSFYLMKSTERNIRLQKSLPTDVAPAVPNQLLKVVASGYVPYDLARTIGGDKIALFQLIPAGTEPHHFEPTPGDIISVSTADLFVYLSNEIEPWATDILKGLSHTQAVQVAPVLEGEDPHVWITPYGALAVAKRIEETLSKADPKNKAYYRANLKNFEQEIKSLHQDFKKGLASCRNYEMIHMGHLAFAALADSYGINLHALAGTSHQNEHSVKKLTDLVKMIQDRHITAIFTEEMISPDLANTVALETGVQILPLYTIHGVSKQDFKAGKTYLMFMQQNLKNLQEGLVCRP